MASKTSTNPKNVKRLKNSALPTLQRKALHKAIAKDCGYHLYEIEDILASLVRVSTEAFLNGNSVRLLHLCTLVPWDTPKKNFYNHTTKQIELSKGSKTLKVIPALYLKKKLNPSIEYSEGENENDTN